MAVIGVAWLALAQGQTLNRGVYEQGTNTISGAKFFLNGLWIGTNAQVTVNASTQLVSVVNGVTNLLGGSTISTNDILAIGDARWLLLGGTASVSTVSLGGWPTTWPQYLATNGVAQSSVIASTAVLFNGHSMLEDAPGGFTPYFLTGNTLLGVKTTTWSSPATMLGYLAVAGALTNGGNATLGTLNVGTITGNGSGLTGTGTTFTAGNALAANYSTSSGIASNVHSGSATTGQVATANGSGGTFWATPAAGGATTTSVWVTGVLPTQWTYNRTGTVAGSNNMAAVYGFGTLGLVTSQANQQNWTLVGQPDFSSGSAWGGGTAAVVYVRAPKTTANSNKWDIAFVAPDGSSYTSNGITVGTPNALTPIYFPTNGFPNFQVNSSTAAWSITNSMYSNGGNTVEVGLVQFSIKVAK
jgi:hypothetical protein